MAKKWDYEVLSVGKNNIKAVRISIWYYVDMPTIQELMDIAQKEFPGTPFSQLHVHVKNFDMQLNVGDEIAIAPPIPYENTGGLGKGSTDWLD